MKSGLIYTIALAALTPIAANAQTATTTNEAQSKTTATSQSRAAQTPASESPAAQGEQQSSQARIDAALHAAAQAHIPTSLLQSKVQEGEAKHVPSQRIAAAVEARLQALKEAKQSMDNADIKDANESELAVAGDAVQAGVKANALVKVYRSTPPERRVVAVAVLSDLVRLGRSSDQALARVSSAVRSNVALANLQAEVASQLHGRGLGATLDANGIVKLH